METSDRAPSQDRDAATKNASFFGDNQKYADRVGQLKLYRHLANLINGELSKVGNLIDIGNGGVFDYDTNSVDSIVAVDLFPEFKGELPANVIFQKGDALNLPFRDGTFDGALMAMVFHHLVGATARDLIENVKRALAEGHRVLAPGGKLVVAESCVPPWFYRVEQRLYRPLAAVSKTRFMEHPPALQLPPEHLVELIASTFGSMPSCRKVPVGALILQFGHRWPTVLTPARPYLLTAQK